jgi:cold shock CspA family protein
MVIFEGKLRYWNVEKGYGFADTVFDNNITRPVFVHAKKIKIGTPIKDARVFYRVVEMPKGPAALDVIIFPPAPDDALAGGN